eukprot:1453417-Prorocentrum_lima.AAC.1
MVTLRISTQEFMDISAEIADTLRRHNVAAATTGKGSSTRICFCPEPVWTKAPPAPPADRPPCTHVPVKAAPVEPPVY